MKKYSIILFLLIVASILTYSNLRVYRSYVQQSVLLSAINNNDFTIIPDELAENIEYEYPNLSVTAMPLATVKGRAIIDKPGRVPEALDLYRKGMEVKSNLYMTESLMSDVYFANGILDSAFYYSKISYEGLPLNTRHFIFYLKTLAAEKNKDKMRETYQKIKNRVGNKEELAKFYFSGMVQFRDSVLYKEAKDFLKNNIISNNEVEIAICFALLGENTVMKADSLNNIGSIFYQQGDLNESLKAFEDAIETNPFFYKFYENKLHNLFLLKNYEEVFSFYKQIPIEINRSNGYIEYITSRSLNILNKDSLACIFLNKSIDLGYTKNSMNYNPCN